MPVQVLIPQWWWNNHTANEAVNYTAELLACLDTSLQNKAPACLPLTLGTLSLLELIDSQCWHNPTVAPVISWGRALVIINERYNALQGVLEYLEEGKKDTADIDLKIKLDIQAANFIKVNYSAFEKHFDQLKNNFHTQIETAISGFKMIPSGTGSSLPESGFLFGSTFIVPHATRACALLNINYHQAVWETPLTVISHAEAIDFLRNDSKGRGITRPKDNISGDAVMAECEARAEKGLLQPWQITYPERYKPTYEQIRINPAIIEEHAEILAEKIKQNG